MADTVLSIIIPTHNREQSLRRLLDNLLTLADVVEREILVIDNNSVDNTKALVESYPEHVRYVFEKNTSFTKARNTGVTAARGEYVLLLDDDVIVSEGTLDELVRMFSVYEKLAVVGGKILPHFESPAPEWIFPLQESFNGLSLFDLGENETTTHGVPGPMMGIRKSAFEAVGGFPPDIIGVETNSETKTFRKLYIGPGDYGFCALCRYRGYEIRYTPKMLVEHVIPPLRLTREFWLSRMIGEGHFYAITARHFSGREIVGETRRWRLLWLLANYWLRAKKKRSSGPDIPLYPEEMWYEHFKARLEMEWVLLREPGFAKYIWDLGSKGVPDEDFESVVERLPLTYRKLVLA